MNNIVTKLGSPWANKVEAINLETAGLAWDVLKSPLVTLLEGKYPLPITSHVAITRSDTNQTLGIVGKDYGPIQNTRIWEALERSLNDVKHDVVGGGYLADGARVFLQVDVNDEDFTVNGEKYNNFITLYSSHDGSSAFEIFDTSIRIICQNTLQAARRHGGARFKLKVRHTSMAEIRFENMMEQIERIFATRRRTYRDLRYLNELFMSHDEIKSWATSFFNAKNELTGNAAAQASRTVQLAINGTGNRGETAYDTFNGLTELLTHGASNTSKPRDEVFRSSEFGRSADLKALGLDSLLQHNVRQTHIVRGDELRRNGSTTIAPVKVA